MALDAGKMAITLEFAKDLKDCDWFGKQDPYAMVTCGTQHYRSRTHIDGGRHPVWNETFEFNVINENEIVVTIMDEDTLTRDDTIGTARVSLVKARESGADHVQAPVLVSAKSSKQRGFISVRLKYIPNQALKAQPAQQPQQQAAQQPQQHGAPWAAPAGYGGPALNYMPAPMAPQFAYAFPQQPQPYAYAPQPHWPQAQGPMVYYAQAPAAVPAAHH